MEKKQILKKNDLCQVRIEDIGNDGEGIGKYEGFPLFIKDAVPGDEVEARITKVKKNYGYARLEKVLLPSPFRVEPKCKYARQCGGCQIQAVSYEKQLEFKQKKVRNNLIRIGGMDSAFVDSVLEEPQGMEIPFYYRNKAQFPIGKNKEGKTITGFYAGRTHSIIENTDCALGVEENKVILEKIMAYMDAEGITPYEEESHQGLVRHILIRKGFATGQLMVCLVINGNKLRAEEKLVQTLSQVPGMTSISISVNREKTNVIMGKEIRLLFGKDQIEDEIDGITFKISPLSFYQVNPVQTERIYAKALEYADLTGNETVWDLYCGIGTISLFLARKAKYVYGVEIVPEAITDARENAILNQIENVDFYVGKAEEVLPEKYEKEGIFADVIVVDPPRKGCDEACLSTMVQMQPKRIVYVSCDSATLARDIKYLRENGYEVVKVKAFDNFPQSVHVETCVLLTHQNIKKHVKIDYEPDGSYMKDVNRHATYKEIQEYIKEKYDTKMHTLYIAQVKRECGIPMGENFNLSEKEDAKVSKVSEEKRAMILDALKHFNMID